MGARLDRVKTPGGQPGGQKPLINDDQFKKGQFTPNSKKLLFLPAVLFIRLNNFGVSCPVLEI